MVPFRCRIPDRFVINLQQCARGISRRNFLGQDLISQIMFCFDNGRKLFWIQRKQVMEVIGEPACLLILPIALEISCGRKRLFEGPDHLEYLA